MSYTISCMFVLRLVCLKLILSYCWVRILLLDHRKAFDLIDHNILMTKLMSYGVPLCPSLTVKNLLPNVDELAILVRSGDHSWSICTSHPCHFGRPAQKFWTIQNFRVPKTNIFHSWLCTLNMCSFLLCLTAYLLYSGCSYCVLGVLTVYYIVRTCKISPEDSAK